MTWEEINADYEVFLNCIFNVSGKNPWSRNDEKGREYLLKAYAKAQLMPEKNHLIYARILFDMYRAFECFNYNRTFSLIGEGEGFLAEAEKEYAFAKEENMAERKELERLADASGRLKKRKALRKYESEQRCKDCWHHKEYLQMLGNYEKLQDFVFHDGVILKFEHLPMEKAVILQICEGYFENIVDGKVKTATFRFEEVSNIEYTNNQDDRWIYDVYFFPDFNDHSLMVFDLELFRIYSKKITVTDVCFLDEPKELGDFMSGRME